MKRRHDHPRRVGSWWLPAAGPLLLTAALALGAAAPAGAQIAVPPVPVQPPGVPAGPAAAATAAPGQVGGEAMVGTFTLRAGECDGPTRGSYFRMIQPGGSRSGPYVQNSDSPCADKTSTPLAPGRDGGLTTGAFQPAPDPPFSTTGGSRADRITRPQRFYGIDFSTATNATDPQTGDKVSPPAISRDASGRLTGDLRAFAASWNNQHFNQGAPKPDGSTPGNTTGPTGTYNATTGAFTLEWSSQIVGGPFNNFTGQWHLEGTFKGSAAPATATTAAPSAASETSEPAAAAAAPQSAVAAAPQSAVAADVAAPSGPHPRTGPTLPSAPLGALALAAGGAGLLARRRLGVGRG